MARSGYGNHRPRSNARGPRRHVLLVSRRRGDLHPRGAPGGIENRKPASAHAPSGHSQSAAVVGRNGEDRTQADGPSCEVRLEDSGAQRIRPGSARLRFDAGVLRARSGPERRAWAEGPEFGGVRGHDASDHGHHRHGKERRVGRRSSGGVDLRVCLPGRGRHAQTDRGLHRGAA
jgi:hypothetical protein